MKASAKDLRVHSKRLLEAVDRGEEVVITYRGRPRARLIPAAAPPTRPRRESGLFGLWKDHEGVGDVQSYVDELRGTRF